MIMITIMCQHTICFYVTLVSLIVIIINSTDIILHYQNNGAVHHAVLNTRDNCRTGYLALLIFRV